MNAYTVLEIMSTTQFDLSFRILIADLWFEVRYVLSTKQPETKVMTFEKRSSHKNTDESRGRQKNCYKCCKPNVLEAQGIQSESSEKN